MKKGYYLDGAVFTFQIEGIHAISFIARARKETITFR